MRLYSSLWKVDDWETRGGLVKTDWTNAPFTASYRNFNADSASSNVWFSQELDSTSQQRLSEVQKKIYDLLCIPSYCNNTFRFNIFLLS